MIGFFLNYCGMVQPFSAEYLLHAYGYIPGYPMAACHVVLYATTLGYFLRALCILPLPLLHCCTFLATGPHTHPALALPLPSASWYQDHYRYMEARPQHQPSFLGILVNTSTFELHLPGDQLTRLQHAIQQWACM